MNAPVCALVRVKPAAARGPASDPPHDRRCTGLDAALREEVAHSAADEAALAVLSRLDLFEGRSRFTTWAYKPS
ncbi:MAG: hypothetical protein L0H83_10200 [Salinisphaera sp.]|nr:hypothetical protein [Salinisphaera sp.]